MSWGAFSNMTLARTAQQRQIESGREQAKAVLADTTLTCTFEGVAAECRRVTYRAPISKILTLGASNMLVAFYAAAEVRGGQAACGFYEDQATQWPRRAMSRVV